jgi:hypothetical protein
MGSTRGSGCNELAAWRRSMELRWTTLKEQLWTPRPLRQKLALGGLAVGCADPVGDLTGGTAERPQNGSQPSSPAIGLGCHTSQRPAKRLLIVQALKKQSQPASLHQAVISVRTHGLPGISWVMTHESVPTSRLIGYWPSSRDRIVSPILGEQYSGVGTVQAIIDRLRHSVEDHMQRAEQFDGLTLLSLKAQA